MEVAGVENVFGKVEILKILFYVVLFLFFLFQNN